MPEVTMPDSKCLVITRGGKSLRVAWDNAAVRKDPIVLLVYWLFILVCGAGAVALAALGGWLALPIPLLIAALLAYTLVGRTWWESIEVGPAGVTHGWAGWLAPRPRIYSFAELRELTFHSPSGEVHDHTPTLSLLRSGTLGSRAPIGYHLPVNDLRQVFEAIRSFVQFAGLPLKCTGSANV